MEDFEKNIQPVVPTDEEQAESTTAGGGTINAETSGCTSDESAFFETNTPAGQEAPAADVQNEDQSQPAEQACHTVQEEPAAAAAPNPAARQTANADGEPRTAQAETARTPVYNANIPGPTKYDRAQRTYRDALNRKQQTGKPAAGDRQAFAIASISLGVFSILMLIIPVIGWILGLGASITGIVLGAFGLKGKMRGLSIAGLIISIVALALIILLIVLFATFIFAAIQEGISTYSYPYRHIPRAFSGSLDEIFPYIR